MSANTRYNRTASTSTAWSAAQWEDIPLDLVDLKRTQAEASARQEKLEKDAKSLTEEEEARKALQKEVHAHPAGSRRLLAG